MEKRPEERCVLCDDLTGCSGDGTSLYCEGCGMGPMCEECWEIGQHESHEASEVDTY